MKVAITYSYSLFMGGAERVLETLAEMFPAADFFCLMADREFVPSALQGRKITTSFLNRFRFLKRHHQSFFALYPLATESLNLGGYELIISSDGMATKGVITDEGARHICYCHSPHRSLWDQYSHYQTTLHGVRKAIFTLSAHYVRQWDFNAAQRVGTFIANSHYMAQRIQKYYRRDSTVIYPPVNTARGFIASEPGDYYLTVGRLTPAKHTEIIVEACTALQRRLLVVGTGDDLPMLRKIAGPTVEFLGYVDEEQLGSLYSQCRAFLFAAKEDFGIAPVEAQSYGRPVIAYGQGGALETVRVSDPSGAPDTGVYFPEQTAESVTEGIRSFESREDQFSTWDIREHAYTFDTSVFKERFGQYVAEMIAQGDSTQFSPEAPSVV